MTDSLPTLRFLPGRAKRVLNGHPWAYSNEIQMDAAAKALAPGSLVRLETAEGEAVGVATFNPHTLIAGRLMTRDARASVGTDFLADRFARALALRDRLFDRPYYRLVHAEADGFPGLIVDRYGDVLVMQANTAGMERLLPDLTEALRRVLAPRAIVLRNDAAARSLEGLAPRVEVVHGDVDGPVELEENGSTFFADVAGGQKTGWFYDQRDNRAFVASLSAGARVIDFYSYNGGFAVQAARAGAASVVAVDRSEHALEMGGRAAQANGVAERCEFRRAEAFTELARLADAKERFDVVVVDPPAFVKSKKDLAAGVKGYRKMVRLAARLVAPGGYLFAASCSHNVPVDMFAEQVARGLVDAGRMGRVLRTSGAGPDHPVHPLLPESAYLKGQMLQLD